MIKKKIKKNNLKNIQVGIEAIGFYTTNTCFELSTLAKSNNIQPEKYTQGLGQKIMSIITPEEDIITMAYNAYIDLNNKISKKNKCDILNEKINLLLFATESPIDNSKSAASELYSHLKHSKYHQCRCIDIKHACYGGTGAIMIAKDHVLANPDKKVLVIMSDVAFYGLRTKGEPTQGCGAVAILLSSKPKIAVFNNDNVFFTLNENDFYRPTYQTKPIYDGHLSIKSYIKMFKQTLNIYNNSFDFFISHIPYVKMLNKCCEIANIDENKNENISISYYPENIGNIYTGSLYIGLISLLTMSDKNLKNKKIALFSYGSGAECELFSLTILPKYKNYLNTKNHYIKILEDRLKINYKEYCSLLKNFEEREKQLNWKLKKYKNKKQTKQKLILSQILNGARKYSLIN